MRTTKAGKKFIWIDFSTPRGSGGLDCVDDLELKELHAIFRNTKKNVAPELLMSISNSEDGWLMIVNIEAKSSSSDEEIGGNFVLGIPSLIRIPLFMTKEHTSRKDSGASSWVYTCKTHPESYFEDGLLTSSSQVLRYHVYIQKTTNNCSTMLKRPEKKQVNSKQNAGFNGVKQQRNRSTVKW